ncbi:hypothetical protein D9757_002496 [Collybiopsis confluens]|uniref:Amidase domain-containing protein n=1 Tax=Collybiopsis confluens TaxID=2823264 RepID=A0A8H5HY19_9AGAR|nr:hypothetical protein D9757_002496 [Collybiopsis confluens]
MSGMLCFMNRFGTSMSWMGLSVRFKPYRSFLMACVFKCRGAVKVNALVVSTALYNLVDSPVGVVPVTRVDAKKDQLTEEWTSPPKSERGSVLMESRLYRVKTPIYDPVKMDGMPVSVQIVGRKWEDEKVIAMMSIVDDAMGGPNRGPGPSEFAERAKT